MTDFEHFLQQHAASVRALAMSILANAADAEDALQDTMLAAVQHRMELDAGRHPKAWLLRIAANKARDMLRRRRVRSTPPPVPRPREPEVDRTRRIIASMPPRYRMVMHLAYYEELPYKDIAEAMGVSLSGVKMMILRGRRMVRARLANEL